MSSLAGSFLVARPTLQDPNFRHTVILLLQHDDDGACGLVVNRSIEVEGLALPVFLGGPCPSPGMFMLHGHAEWVGPSADLDESEEAADRELAPGIYIGDASSLEQAREAPADQVKRFRVFRGYAGWGPGQLEGELAAGAWVVQKATGQLLFETPVDDLWDRLAPPTIPQPSLN